MMFEERSQALSGIVVHENQSPDLLGRRLAVVLAPKRAACEALVEQLLELDYWVEQAATLSQAQRLVTRHKPRFVFVDCTRFPIPGRDIASLMRQAADSDPPRVVGLAHGGCAACRPDFCDLAKVLGAPVDLADLEVLLYGHRPADTDDATVESGCVDADSDPHSAAYGVMEEIPAELQAILLQVFVEDTAVRLDRINSSLRNHDLRAVGREAHAIKSGCLQVGDEAMAACCERLHRAAKDAETCLAHRCYKELLEAFHAAASRTPRG